MRQQIECGDGYVITLEVRQMADKPWPFHVDLAAEKQVELEKILKATLKDVLERFFADPVAPKPPAPKSAGKKGRNYVRPRGGKLD